MYTPAACCGLPFVVCDLSTVGNISAVGNETGISQILSLRTTNGNVTRQEPQDFTLSFGIPFSYLGGPRAAPVPVCRLALASCLLVTSDFSLGFESPAYCVQYPPAGCILATWSQVVAITIMQTADCRLQTCRLNHRSRKVKSVRTGGRRQQAAAQPQAAAASMGLKGPPKTQDTPTVRVYGPDGQWQG